jgi:uncharacterized OsmC-like protein
MKIILLSDDEIRLEPVAGQLTVEAVDAAQEYSPFHMLASSLAVCTFSVMESWATHTRQRVDDLAINVQWRFSSDEPKRVSELQLTYEWPSLPAKKAGAAQRVAELCTIHATLTHPPGIHIDAAAPAVTATADDASAGAHVPVAGV